MLRIALKGMGPVGLFCFLRSLLSLPAAFFLQLSEVNTAGKSRWGKRATPSALWNGGYSVVERLFELNGQHLEGASCILYNKTGVLFPRRGGWGVGRSTTLSFNPQSKWWKIQCKRTLLRRYALSLAEARSRAAPRRGGRGASGASPAVPLRRGPSCWEAAVPPGVTAPPRIPGRPRGQQCVLFHSRSCFISRIL